ncbi:hypothetical protein PRZ48_003684 [Zasmidium cellare]|uniref:Nudix hydrolase domain-containing protein n=1 Tax=Zasmidium cellare TaxID=395010 RepID=A0ABR0EVS4_ZASCE|nr:hypothetical protein PRZ48_003684 [Zasmidium cellare]
MAEAEAVESSPFTHMTLGDCLDDLTVRFLLNLPPGELSSIPRLCFQVEEAQWFYEDFIRPLNPTLPGLNLRDFLLTLFRHCPLLSGFDATQHVAAYEQFLEYKTRVPVRGAILMNDDMDKVLLVRGWKKGSRWSFPRGKINKDEPDLDCAIREVYEETGFDIHGAGLVDTNMQGGQVKSIDVTMREQHMKLFVFRGVSMDTYFEPKTRKEISKIQWYNVKDLPGFKKAKGVAGQGQGEAAATKFYMVAPFLGHLKKWIGQQRRNDSTAAQVQHGRSLSAANNGVSTGITEDEGDTEAEVGVEHAARPVDRSADELKRILSIGGPAIELPPVQQGSHQPGSDASGLLAMLQGGRPAAAGGSIPHTPFEQIDPDFPPKEPETPQPRHPRDPAVGFQQAVPSFPQLQQPQQHYQRNYSVPVTGMDRPSSGHFQHSQQPSLGGLPPHMQQFAQPQQRQHSMPNFPPGQAVGPPYNGNQFSGPHNGRPHSQGPLHPQFANMPQFAGPALPLASPLNPVGDSSKPQGLPFDQMFNTNQKPIGSDPSMPEPSKLPPPKLNAHSAKLLDAFKSSSSTKSTVTDSNSRSSNGQRAGSQQQAALLDLFKKSPAPAQEKPAAASPTLTDTTEKPMPPRASARTPSFNEITRTLPPKPVVKAPASPASSTQTVRPPPPKEPVQPVQPTLPTQPKTHVRTQPAQTMRAPSPRDETVDRPKSRGQLYDPTKPQQFVRASSQSRPEDPAEQKPPVTILQKLKSGQPSRSPKASPQVKPRQPATENGPAPPQISILQRPGSSTGRTPRSPIPQSPLRHESTKSTFQPQVLKRPSAGDENAATGTDATPGDDKKNHLLSLFAKSSSTGANPGPSPTPAQAAAPVSPNPPSNGQQKNTLLGLFNGAATSNVATKTPEPPAAPQIQPERKPSSQGQQPNGSQQSAQQVLLNLFNKPSSGGADSPGTPISPFTLGTPATKEPPLKQQLPLSTLNIEPRSRLGSLATLDGNGPVNGQQTPRSATPTEQTKGFLLDYLNGVVQKEGHRGAKR